MSQPVQQVAPRDVAQKLSSTSAPFVLDVRMPLEIATDGAIEGSTLIPLPELPARIAEVPTDREVICVCKSGMRSTNAAMFLQQRGVAASSLAGGMMAWAAAGLPIKR